MGVLLSERIDHPSEAADGALRVSLEAMRDLTRIAEAAYPAEGCGLLIGDGRTVVEARGVENVWPAAAERGHRFLLDPLTQMRTERGLQGSGRSVVGNFHSHPDHPAAPSAFDTDAAWLGYWYIIVPVAAGVAGQPRAWRIDPATGAFVEHIIVVDPL
jgi:proteasome lid subunit RPN8/RPN11